ncbi:unnamed protein product [Brachionus calyciflorus]|uniref:HTH CENPB-type domain-containing protein n=1 Tax=Brachionus calyciflorus TaxID=104777 RepID=A0A814PLZ1_9BILA|nr:unnamed protein product [Brachionus calyciflorus]
MEVDDPVEIQRLSSQQDDAPVNYLSIENDIRITNTSCQVEPKDHIGRCRFNLEFNLKVITFHSNGNSINKCAQHFEIDRRIVSRWIRNQERIKGMKLKRSTFRCKSVNDLASYPFMENQLIEWIKEKRETGACISGLTIKQKAIELYNSIYMNINEASVEFKANNGWLLNFCKRKKLVVRRITTSGRDLPSNTITIIKNFFNTYQNIVNKSNFSKEKVINMDETCIYLDFPSNYTYASKGSKRVKAQKTGGEHARISAGFTASADFQFL